MRANLKTERKFCWVLTTFSVMILPSFPLRRLRTSERESIENWKIRETLIEKNSKHFKLFRCLIYLPFFAFFAHKINMKIEENVWHRQLSTFNVDSNSISMYSIFYLAFEFLNCEFSVFSGRGCKDSDGVEKIHPHIPSSFMQWSKRFFIYDFFDILPRLIPSQRKLCISFFSVVCQGWKCWKFITLTINIFPFS